MKLFPRYRRPSLNTVLGISQAKRRIKKQLGIAAIENVVNAPKNYERSLKRRIGYYSEPMKFLRFLGRILK